MDEKLTFNEKQKKKEMEIGEGNQTYLMGEFSTRKKRNIYNMCFSVDYAA